MNVSSVQSTYTFAFSSGASTDSEEDEIAARLLAYGEIPSGDKTTDRAKLRRIETEKAKQESVASNKFMTVSSQEMEKMIEKKKGATILGNYNKAMLGL